jgi:hypothetical protein
MILPALAFLIQGCAQIELRSLIRPQTDMAQYSAFTIINQADSKEQNYLRDEVLLDYASLVMSRRGYTKSITGKARAHVTLVFNEGFKEVFVPPSTQPIISYTPGEFTTVAGKINGETVNLFGYVPPRRIERYVERPGYKIDVYKLMLRIDIYDSANLSMIWTGTAYMESSPGSAIDDAKKMIDRLLENRLPGLEESR